MKLLVISILFFSISTSHAEFVINADDSETPKEVLGKINQFKLKEFVNGLGYDLEPHTVDTDDGYQLEIHQVSDAEHASNKDDKPVVLLWHGFLGSSADFFHIGKGKSLPLRLVDEGYDVWVGNNRGNTWGRKHKTLDPDKDAEFWDFCLTEPATLDIPSTIDYILNTTQKTELSFVGHSTGASQFFILASSKPEYNKKVNVMAALAPVVYINHTTSLLLALVNDAVYPAILDLEKSKNVSEILPHGNDLNIALNLICGMDKLKGLCPAVLFFLTGFDKSEITMENVKQFVKSFPAGTSAKELNHFLQWRITGNFAQYNYGKIENLDKYGHVTPPAYNLSKVSTPVAVYYGKNDFIVSIKDIKRLLKDLPNVVDNHVIDYKRFNHIDFLLANDVDSFANYHVINTLNGYNKKDNITSTTTTTTSYPPTTQNIPTSTTEAGAASIGSSGYFTIMLIISATLFNYKYLS